MWTIVFKKNFNFYVSCGGCDNTDGPFMAFTSRTGYSRCDTVRLMQFFLLAYVSLSTASPALSSLLRRGREKLGEVAWNDLSVQRPYASHVFGYTRERQHMTLWTFTFSEAPPNRLLPALDTSGMWRWEIAIPSSSQLRALLRLEAHSSEKDREISWCQLDNGTCGCRGAIPGCLCHFLLCQWVTRSLEVQLLGGDEAVICETESYEVGPDPGTEIEAKPAVPREESWVPSYYEEKHPWEVNKWATTEKWV